MKRYAVPVLISAIVPPLLYLPFLMWSHLEPIQVWACIGWLPVIGLLLGLRIVLRYGLRSRADEESLYFYTASPAITAIVVQAIAFVAFSYFDGGIFVRLELKGWVFLFAGVFAFIAWLKFPVHLARHFSPENKEPNRVGGGN